jgi:hypothetical protein
MTYKLLEQTVAHALFAVTQLAIAQQKQANQVIFLVSVHSSQLT